MSTKNDTSLIELMTKFDEIVAWFEQDEFDVEEAILKYEEGETVAKEIKRRLTKLENKITVLKQRFDGDV